MSRLPRILTDADLDLHFPTPDFVRTVAGIMGSGGGDGDGFHVLFLRAAEGAAFLEKTVAGLPLDEGEIVAHAAQLTSDFEREALDNVLAVTQAGDAILGKFEDTLGGGAGEVSTAPIAFTPATLDFGQSDKAVKRGPLAAKLSNRSGKPLTIFAKRIDDDLPHFFTFTDDCPAVLEDGKDCKFLVTFDDRAVKAAAGGVFESTRTANGNGGCFYDVWDGTLTVESDDAKSPHQVKLVMRTLNCG